MSKRQIFDFLRDLRDNNSKDWMDENRDRYHTAKASWLEEVDAMLQRLRKHDPSLEKIVPKECIMRINNNNVFHPDKPTYKDNFGFDPYRGRGRVSFYVHVSPSGSFIGGGLYHPDRDQLKSIREAIDYDGHELKKLMDNNKFHDYFGGFGATEDALKTSPRDYDAEHEHIEMLRLKSFVVMHDITQKEIISPDFVDEVEKAFLLMQPFNDYLRKAISVKE